MPATVHDINQARLNRCRMLTCPFANRCPNPALTEYGVCMRHLQECAQEWRHARQLAGLPATGTEG